MTKTVGIFIFDQVEVLDFAGPYEVFTCASRVHGGATNAPTPTNRASMKNPGNFMRAFAADIWNWRRMSRSVSSP